MDEQELTRKIGLLLAKAEGTDNEAEAAAFYGKAYELMTRYAIDEARVRAVARQTSGRQVEEPVVEDCMYSSYAHHAKAKEDLFNRVCKSQGVRFWAYSNRKYSNDYRVKAAGKTGLYESQWGRVLGYKGDIENAKMLFLSLLIQSTRFANEDWRHQYGDAKTTDGSRWGDGKFMWTSAHMEGFAHRIGERFTELREAIYNEVKDANALILDKDANILEWMYEHGYARRPTPPKYYCWTIEPETNRPRNQSGSLSKRWEPAYCVIVLTTDEAGQPQPHEGPHQFTYHSLKMSNSYYVSKGRRESYEGREAGKAAGNRADIGLTRMTSGNRALKEG